MALEHDDKSSSMRRLKIAGAAFMRNIYLLYLNNPWFVMVYLIPLDHNKLTFDSLMVRVFQIQPWE